MGNGGNMGLYRNSSWFSTQIQDKSCNLHSQVSYDHRSYERNLSNCVWKPEKVRTSTGFEPVTSRYWCDAQYMKHFIYHFTSILHGLIRTHK